MRNTAGPYRAGFRVYMHGADEAVPTVPGPYSWVENAAKATRFPERVTQEKETRQKLSDE